MVNIPGKKGGNKYHTGKVWQVAFFACPSGGFDFYKIQAKEGFYNSVLDRKYFLMEESGKYAYFKLPILIFYGDKDAAASENVNVGNLSLQKLKSEVVVENNEELAAMLQKLTNAKTKVKTSLEAKDAEMAEAFSNYDNPEWLMNGIFGLISSYPKWGKEHNKLGYGKALAYTQKQHADPVPYTAEHFLNLNTGQRWDEKTTFPKTVGKFTENEIELEHSWATHKPLPKTEHVYWTGDKWVVVNSVHFGLVLKEVWLIWQQFKSGADEPYTNLNPEKNFQIAAKKIELLTKLKNLKIAAKYLIAKEAPDKSNKSYYNINLFEARYETSHAWWHKRDILKLNLIPIYTNEKDGVDKITLDYASSIDTLESEYEAAFADTAIADIAKDQRFKMFANSIQYKSLLSFLSITIAELIERNYPQIDTMFAGTLNAVKIALDTLLAVANRGNDPNFYQKSSFDAQDPAAAGIDQNWVPLVLEMLLKSLANASDPTWKTPWFFPGPLTPIGCIAKILDAQEDDKGSNATKDIAGKQNIKCSTDEGNS